MTTTQPPSSPVRRATTVFLGLALLPTAVDVSLLLLLRHGWHWLLVVADAIAIAIASVVSYGLHRATGPRSNPYARWTENVWGFAAVAIVAGAADILVLRAAYAVHPTAGLDELLAAKVLAVAVAAVLRGIGYRALLTSIIRANRVMDARPLEDQPIRLSVVFPAYREADRIGATIDATRRELDGAMHRSSYEIVVVDDGSGDGTSASASAAGADQVVTFEHNQGKGAAVRAGCLAAEGRVVCFTDADLAYAPAHLLAVLAEVERGWDVVVGNRRLATSSTVRQSRLRALGSRLINQVSSVVLLDAPLDTQCGLKGFRRDVAREIFSRTRVDGFAFDVEVLHLVERGQWTLAEIPVVIDESGASSTVHVVRDGLALLRDVARIRRLSAGGAYAMSPSRSRRTRG